MAPAAQITALRAILEKIVARRSRPFPDSTPFPYVKVRLALVDEAERVLAETTP